MRMPLLDQLELVRDVIENEHGGMVFTGESYLVPEWDLLQTALVKGLEIIDKEAVAYRNLEKVLENT